MPAARKSTNVNRDRFFSALNESIEATMDAIKSGNERGYRFSGRLLGEVQRARQEMGSLSRRFARDPKDVRGLYEASIDLARRSAKQSSDLAQEWLAGAQQAGQELRGTTQKVIRANRSASQALAAAVMAAAADLRERADSEVRRRITKRVTGRAPARRAPARRRTTRRRPTRRRKAPGPTTTDGE